METKAIIDGIASVFRRMHFIKRIIIVITIDMAVNTGPIMGNEISFTHAVSSLLGLYPS